MLVGGLRASEHDSFSGACSGRIVTPQRGDGVQAGGGRIDAGKIHSLKMEDKQNQNVENGTHTETLAFALAQTIVGRVKDAVFESKTSMCAKISSFTVENPALLE